VALVGLGFVLSASDERSEQRKRKVQTNKEKPIDPPYPAPSGFKWYLDDSIKCGILYPLGWFLKKDPLSFGISKEELRDSKQQLSTGTTISCMPRQGSELLRKWLDTYPTVLTKEGKIIQSAWKKIQLTDQLASYSFEFQDPPEMRSPITVFNQVVFNQITGTVYFISFEAPTSQYQEVVAQYGTQMLKSMFFDPRL